MGCWVDVLQPAAVTDVGFRGRRLQLRDFGAVQRPGPAISPAMQAARAFLDDANGRWAPALPELVEAAMRCTA